MASPLVAVQVGAVSFIDEGVGPVLDILQERGGANALFLATPTWTAERAADNSPATRYQITACRSTISIGWAAITRRFTLSTMRERCWVL